MLQRMCRQLGQAGLLESACIVTHESQAEMVASQVGEALSVLTEPFKKGTFTAIALAAAYLHGHAQASSGDTVCVLPVDAFVLPAFYEGILRLPLVLERSGAALALIGTPPAGPSGQFGYMVPAAGPRLHRGRLGYELIGRFVEKPDESLAKELIESGALWNCGVFGFSLGFMLQEMAARALPLEVEALKKQYAGLPVRSFDQEVVERTERTAAVVYEGEWEDLGSWASFTRHLEDRVTGPGCVDGNSPGSHLVNELSFPIHLIDVPDVIVAASPDGVLVASKSRSSLIKEQLEEAGRPPLFEEKRWGTRRVLEYGLAGSVAAADSGQPAVQGTAQLAVRKEEQPEQEVLTCKLTVLPGKSFSYHLHRRRREVLLIQSGQGECLLDGKVLPVRSGDVLQIPAGVSHSLRAITALECLSLHVGTALLQPDEAQVAGSWEDAQQLLEESLEEAREDPEEG